jgi:outer membrane lipoprotein-sorting protein
MTGMPLTPLLLTRRDFVVTTAAAVAIVSAVPASAALPPASEAQVDRIRAYLDGITTLEARFQQVNPDGGMASGRLYIQRPGKMRFDYDPPSQVLLIATDWRLIFWDGSIEQQNVIPVAETPLGFLLGRSVELGDAYEITRVDTTDEEIELTVIRTGAPDQGSVQLTFAAEPVELRRWLVTDAQGLLTQVVLRDIVTGQPLDAELFRWRDPKIFGPPKT